MCKKWWFDISFLCIPWNCRLKKKIDSSNVRNVFKHMQMLEFPFLAQKLLEICPIKLSVNTQQIKLTGNASTPY